MLPFHQTVVAELLEDNNGGLVVLGSGLALHKIVSSLIRLHSTSQGTLFILTASDSQRFSIKEQLQNDPNKPLDIYTEYTSQERQSLYSDGGVFFITSRILIVDLLNSKVPISKIAGIIILNAHRLTETCTEAFIVRIFRSSNRTGYVRAFSDKPQSMVSGFAKTERIMKCLFVRKLHLWPRFQVFVSEDLEKEPPNVIDIRISPSVSMIGIQNSILEVMDACLKELRKTNKVDVEDLTVENGLFKSFDEIVRRQLDPIWHQIGKKTKQLVADLKTLRKLVDYLVRYDSVTYLKYLDTLRVSEGVRSVWIFAGPSHKIFELAKKRVYQLMKLDGCKIPCSESKEKRGRGKFIGESSKRRKVTEEHKNENDAAKSSVSKGVDNADKSSVVLDVVLEEAPKWKVLREVLEEIEEERLKQALSGEEKFMVEAAETDSCTVLVACKDECSCMQLQDCIMRGPQQVMREEWEKYLLGKAELHGLRARSRKKPQDPKGFGVLNGTILVGSRENTEASSISKMEHDALLAAAAEMSILVKDEVVGDGSRSHIGTRGSARGRGRRSSTKDRRTRGKIPDNEKLSKKNKFEIFESENMDNNHENDPIDTGKSAEKEVFERQTREADTNEFIHTRPLSVVQFYALESDQHILDVVKPSAIVVYHPDMTFVREIEIYKAENPLLKLKVYFLFYENSTEVQKFEASIRRENLAFESLIRQKSLMMIPVDQDGCCLGLGASSEPQSLIPQNALTRKAGGRKAPEKEMQVIVDMREFMSSLPNVLHQNGMRIVPVTLEVGDYVLSPLICVERKSILDLFSSFASGRLYNQVEMMVRYYRIPVLLIEFSQDKSFSFQSASEIGDDVEPTSIISKLSLLLLHFPRLRLVWSRSLHSTAEIFASLKANQDEPDESKAMRVGVPTEEGVVENDVRAENYNTSAVEFLRRLPGVTDSNYRAVMDGCKSLAELALLPIDRLAELMGGQKVARTLRDFLDAKCPTLL